MEEESTVDTRADPRELLPSLERGVMEETVVESVKEVDFTEQEVVDLMEEVDTKAMKDVSA